MAVERLFDSPDGGVFGRSAGKIGFYGLTAPIVKQTLTTALVAGNSVGAMITSLIEINAALAALGLVTTA